MDIADSLEFDLNGTKITLDAGFDSEFNKTTIAYYGLVPVIYPNKRGIKDQKKIEQLFLDFDEQTYKERYKIERCFAWQDTYRKLVIRYEKLRCTHLGFKYLAYSMINYRCLFNKRCFYSLWVHYISIIHNAYFLSIV